MRGGMWPWSSRPDANRVNSDTTTQSEHQRFIDKDPNEDPPADQPLHRNTEIEKLYMSLPNTYSYNSTRPQLEHMLDATVRYSVATNGSPIMTFRCKCVIIRYDKNDNIMTAIIKSPSGGWEIDSTPIIHKGALQLTPILPVKLNLTGTGQTNIVDITISKSTIDGAIASKIKSSSSTASR